jgi:hypothetical protein
LARTFVTFFCLGCEPKAGVATQVMALLELCRRKCLWTWTCHPHHFFIIKTFHTDDDCFSANGEWFDPHEAYNLLVNVDLKKKKHIGSPTMFVLSYHFPIGLSFKYNLNA